MTINKGWICPMCEVVNSSSVKKCRRCGDEKPCEIDPDAETKEMPPIKIEEEKTPDENKLADPPDTK